MNKEEIKVMIKDGVYSEDGITYVSDKQYNNYIDIIEQLQPENQSLKKENKILRENAEHNDKVVVKVNWENLKLKKQLEEANTTLDTHNELIEYMKKQQTNFIAYLEYQVKLQEELNDNHLATGFEEILQKYKEIIESGE